jgi:hypothetical protein
MERDWGAPLSMWEAGSNRQINLGGDATVRYLHSDVKADPGALYVELLDGPYAGRRGWVAIQYVDSGDVALGLYDMAYPTKDCQ